jgi:hypothetical protein
LSVLLGVIGTINFVQLFLVRKKAAYLWWCLQTTPVQAPATTTRKATNHSSQHNREQVAWSSPDAERFHPQPSLRSRDPQRGMHALNVFRAEFSEAAVCFRFRLKMLSRPGIELLQKRPELSSERGQRVFNTHRHFGEHLSFDKTIPLKLSQLLRQYLLRNSRHVLPEDFEPERLFGAHKPPENDWFPSAANQDEQFFDRTLADNTFSAHFNFGDQVSIWFLVSPSGYKVISILHRRKRIFFNTTTRLAAA